MQQNQLPQVQMYPIQNQVYPLKQQFIGVQVEDGLQKLANSQGICIRQKFEIIEALAGCETPNIYKVYPADCNGQKIGNQTIFKCKEKSNCFARQCLPGDCLPFSMKVSNQQGTFNNGQFDKTLFLKFQRPFRCTFLCLDRPEMTISFVENGQNKIFGKVKNPCMILSFGCHIEDSKGNLKYIITGSCCQLGYLCMGCPCKSCQEYTFDVKDPSGQVVTRLQKQSADCLQAFFSDVDNFALGFPPGASPEDKALLMAAALFLDYMYFENKHEEQKSSKRNK